ncbi:hypothetical protein F7725_021093 [Dissostichus mawsoni]|uniref:MEIS N-terminal domain-containing protein n=1 Tax=Dissostichus mawsoni TaxID=36200 RepID=A0A7J5YF52_DISMA|nr:hypothetical protein F7725_021093 [Dissostichus mawsoni]
MSPYMQRGQQAQGAKKLKGTLSAHKPSRETEHPRPGARGAPGGGEKLQEPVHPPELRTTPTRTGLDIYPLGPEEGGKARWTSRAEHHLLRCRTGSRVAWRRGHPLFPLLALVFEKCELATCSPRDSASLSATSTSPACPITA